MDSGSSCPAMALFMVSEPKSIPEGTRSVPHPLPPAPGSAGCVEDNVPETANGSRLQMSPEAS